MLSRTKIKNKTVEAYLIGVALGDGNLSLVNNRSVRLRISCDLKYPALIQKIKTRLQILLPNNKVSEYKKKDSKSVDISSYSNQWESILGWEAKKGSKFNQQVAVPKWIKLDNHYSMACLEGLIETDGALYKDRGYPNVIFTSIIKPLAQDVFDMFISLGFSPKIYEIKPAFESSSKTRYNVRLTKNVQQFIELTGLVKE